MPAGYFAYGSNMAESIMADWCGAHRFVGPARLDGFALVFLRDSVRWKAGAADVVPQPESVVWGALYELPEEDLAALDRKEFHGSGYQRREVEVVVNGAGRRPAVTYEVIEKAPRELVPKLEYLDLLVAGARERGLPGDYVEWLEALPERFSLKRPEPPAG